MTAAAISPATGRTYGVEQTCAVFWVSRSSFYAWRSTRRDPAPATTVGRRGGRSPRSGMPICWQRSAPISPARPGMAKATARFGQGCGCSTASGSAAAKSCG